MNKINILPENLINQIAAGEVVERPASVVKELIENALDAGTNNLVIEISNGGTDLIRVTDNGQGMNREDAILCFERHATSKIKNLNDLETIGTMGFRGEALASIASVSNITLKTRESGENVGTEIENHGGEITKVTGFGGGNGTQILIRDLFFNTPARKKFLKSQNTEFQNILGMVTCFALIFNKISFKLIKDEKEIFDLPATKDIEIRLRGLLGKAISDELIPIFYHAVNIKIEGFIGKPAICRTTRNLQYFFVNKRPIKSPTLSYAIKNAFGNLIPKDRYPISIINFEIDPLLVDVNVHPRKTEVKFSDEKEIFRVLYLSCSKALQNGILTPKFDRNISPNFYTDRKVGDLEIKNNVDARLLFGMNTGTKKPILVSKETENLDIKLMPEMTKQLTGQNESLSTSLGIEITPLFQFRNAFIVCQKKEDLLFIDQHAAHERIRYEKLKKDEGQKLIDKQPLLTPLSIDLSQGDLAILNNNKEVMEELGFEIEHFGGNSFSIQAVPATISKLNLEKIILGIIDDLRNEQGISLVEKKDQIIKYMACRSAVKFGDKMSMEEMRALVDEIQITKNNASCPHGRPSMMILTWEEMWNRFGRNYGYSKNEYQC